MPTKNFKNLTLDKGSNIENGKTVWPDFVQVYIEDPKETMRIAMDIMRQVENRLYSENASSPVSFSLPGMLEDSE